MACADLMDTVMHVIAARVVAVVRMEDVIAMMMMMTVIQDVSPQRQESAFRAENQFRWRNCRLEIKCNQVSFF